MIVRLRPDEPPVTKATKPLILLNVAIVVVIVVVIVVRQTVEELS
jgi:hypothetical protein